MALNKNAALTSGILEQFPNQTLCEVIKRKSALPKKLNDKKLHKRIKEWIKWFSEQDAPVDFLRARLDEGDLYFKKYSEEEYLMILNDDSNQALLLKFLQRLDFNEVGKPEDKPAEPSKSEVEVVPSTQDTILEEYIFVNKPIDIRADSFVWNFETETCKIKGLINFRGWDKTSDHYLCVASLDEAFSDFKVEEMDMRLAQFYHQITSINEHRESTKQLRCEVGIVCLDTSSQHIQFISTGIHGLLLNGDANFIRAKRIIKNSQAEKFFTRYSCPMGKYTRMFLYNRGLIDQAISKDEKLGHSGIWEIIRTNREYTSWDFNLEFHNFIESNMQYDDIILLGLLLN